MQFSEIQLPTMELKIINLLGNTIQVKQYLPMAEKNAILEMVVQTADGGTVVNSLALEAVFELYLIFKYTDIEFSEEEKNDLFGTYDKLECNGMIEEIIKAIPESEYKLLHESLEDIVKEYKNYRNSAKGCLDTLSIFAPSAAEKLNEAIAQMDTDKIQNVVELANATNFRK